MPEKDDAWIPKSRDDWAGVFADGMESFMSRREEAEAKAAAENPPVEDPTKEGGKDDNDENSRPNAWDNFTSRILGGST